MCDGVYQLVFLSPEVLSNETWRDTLIQFFFLNMTITYTFVATNRAKKIAYGVGRDSLPLSMTTEMALSMDTHLE